MLDTLLVILDIMDHTIVVFTSSPSLASGSIAHKENLTDDPCYISSMLTLKDVKKGIVTRANTYFSSFGTDYLLLKST